MEVRICRVTIADTAGVSHTVEVTAGALYEAVALGLTAMRSHDWAAELVYGKISVSVQNVSVEHTVRIGDFYQWLERHGGSPAEVTRRRKVREILGLASP